jgi:Tetratricopeptide repeat
MLPFSPGKAIRTALGLTILLAGAIWQMMFAYQEQENFRERFERNVSPHPRNVAGLTYAAKQKHMIEADLTTAKSLLRQALSVNPSFVPAWLSLAELENDLGNKDKASAILRHADQLTQGLKRWRWDKALTAYQLGHMELLPGELSFIIREIGGKPRNDALQLAFTIWPSPQEVLEQSGKENIPHLLSYAVGKKFIQHALFFWTERESSGGEWQDKEALALIDMLLRQGEVHAASGIWKKHFKPEQLIYNGHFATPFLNQAFGWRTGKKQNFDLLIEKNRDGGSFNSVHYRFKGWENINFTHLYQIVPIQGGREYSLRAEMKSEKLSTNQRPFLELSGYKCKAPVTTSEMVDADQEWKAYFVSIQVPEECAAIVVRLRRKESNHIDNKLAGQFWLRKVELAPVDDLPQLKQAASP